MIIALFFSIFRPQLLLLLLLQYSRNFYACLTNWDVRGIWNVVQQVYYLYYSLKLPLLCYSTTTTGPRKSAVCFLTEILKKLANLYWLIHIIKKIMYCYFKRLQRIALKFAIFFIKIVPIRTIHKCFLHINIFVEMICLIWCYFSWEKIHVHTRRWIWIYKVYIIVVVINYVKMAC